MIVSLVFPLVVCVGPGWGGESPGLGTVIQFNLICSTCHEGECSGRFTFSSGPQAALQHIRRYTSRVDPVAEGELYDLLRRMKLDCSYFPIPPPGGAAGPWSRETLLPYRHAASNGYFIPLGDLPAGSYRLSLRFDQAAAVRVEVVSDTFEPLWDPGWDSCDAGVEKTLQVELGGAHYLRVRTPGNSSIFLDQVSISRLTQGATPP